MDTKKPKYLHEKLVGSSSRPAYATRLCVGGNLRHGPDAKLSLTSKSLRWRVRNLWGKVPTTIRAIADNMTAFKGHLREWLWSKVDLRI